MKTTGVIIARFQTPYLHEGHVYLLNEIRSRHNKVVVVLGVSPVKGSRRNPFDFYTRERMLKHFWAELVVLPLKDQQSDAMWSEQLDALLRNAFPQEAFLLYGSRDSFIPYYSGRLAVEPLAELGDHSGTVIRDENSDKVLDSVDFRQGINYAFHNVYAKVYPTVDIAVLRENDTEVLMGKKRSTFLWRFPGGFADPGDDDYERAVQRELREECGEVEIVGVQYVGSAKIDDWRYRQGVDKIITLLFRARYVGGEAKGGDDLAVADWVAVKDLPAMMAEGQIAAEHLVLVRMLLNQLNALPL